VPKRRYAKLLQVLSRQCQEDSARGPGVPVSEAAGIPPSDSFNNKVRPCVSPYPNYNSHGTSDPAY
jgi:hypothetical protein